MILTIAAMALILNWIVIYVARRVGLTDIPDRRKKHQGAIPLTGGIAIFATLLAGIAFLGITPYTNNMLIVATLVFSIGVYDDFDNLGAALRLIIQYGSGIALATYGGIYIENVGNLLNYGDIPLLLLSAPLTALSVAGLSNAYNMIDGIDGLAAATILLPLLILYGLALADNNPMAPTLLLMVIPLCIFLIFNLGPDNSIFPKIFLGDAGSTTMGFLVTASLVYFSQGEDAVILPVTALWLVTVPLMDMLATMLRRWRSGRKLMTADRSHLHHTLMDRGLSGRATLIALIIYATVCASFGLALQAVAESLSLLMYFLLFLAHCFFVIHSGRKQKPTVA